MLTINQLRTEAILEPTEIIFPNVERWPSRYGGGVTTKELMEAVPMDTTAIIFFGSAVRRRKTVSGTTRCLLWKWEFKFRRWPEANDVDVLAIVSGESNHGKTIKNEYLGPGFGEYGGFCGMYRAGTLHIACLREQEFLDSLEGGSTAAMSIVREGVLFAGDTRILLERRQAFRRVGDQYKRVPSDRKIGM